MRRAPSQAAQIVGALLVALAIAAVAIAVVTAHFGPTSTAALEAQEDRIDARIDAREEAAKQREDAIEERRKEADSRGGNSGPG
jgi:hypothetical protein